MDQKLDKSILNKAVQLLAQRDHSSYELTQKLVLFFSRKLNCDDEDYPELKQQLKQEISLTIEYCICQNWINDTQYIEKYITMRANKGYGRQKIAVELKQRGLPEQVSRQLLNASDIDWAALAYQQLQKKFKQIDLKNNLQKQKSIQFLIYRGYTQSDVKTMYTLLT